MLTLMLLLNANASAAGLSKLIDHCDAMAQSHGGCGDLDKPVWKRFESNTGEVTKLDTASVEPAQQGGAIAMVYSYTPGTYLDLRRLRRVHFTCRGQYEDFGSIGYLQDAPPRSVIGAVAATVYTYAEPKRRMVMQRQRELDADAHERAIRPRPEDYCINFSAEACDRIQAGVEEKTKPAFCQPGFGLVGSGLNAEQLRICYARAPKDDPL